MTFFNKTAILIAFIICTYAQGFELANQDRLGLGIYSIERTMRLDDEDVDIATAALLVSQEWDDSVNIRWYRSKIDQMATDIYKNASSDNRKPSNIELIKQINSYLYGELGFGSVDDANDWQDLLLHSVIDRRQGYCLSLSILYLAIGQRLGLPLWGVVVPGHFFVRYDDGRQSFNIEATSKGGVGDDEHYITKFSVPIDISENMYMRKLSNLETLGCFFNNVANCYTIEDDDKTAEKFLNYSVELAPLLAEARNNLGNIYYNRSQFYKAANEFKQASRINPNDAKSLVNLGNVYLAQEQIISAIGQFNNAVKADANSGDAYIGLARCYRARQMPQAALSYLDKGLAVETGAKFWREYGLAYKDLEHYDIALEYFTRALEEKPDWTDVYFEMALIYTELKNNQMAINCYNQALDIDPKLLAAVQNLANIYLIEKDYNQALETFLYGLDIEEYNPELNFGVGICYGQLKDYDTAAKYYNKVIKADNKHQRAYFNLAVCYYNLEQFDKALENAQKAEEFGYKLPDGLIEELKKKL